MGVGKAVGALSEETLERATRLFWEKGYEATTVADLADRTGLHRAAIYGEFGSKRRLFTALLQRYRERVAGAFMAPLAPADASLAEVERFFRGLGELAGRPEGRRGCLLVLSAAETAPREASVARVVEAYLDDLRGRLARALENARRRDELSPRVDCAATADYLAGAVLGLMTLARSPAPRSVVRNYLGGIRTFLAGLERASSPEANSPA
ncbi:TetR/AcrR family transcriptional regulator [Anaeromyxobacter oryzisoli]|uniref:TetR/AcrR family transcriptional regulator n=1 Tax=Anaeromyxobacter oryzisoli TaxID=2925408 RepID=UPI001F563F80|nr:TetR/AcrR family transcriptional regulator [Anaeromyxobacter sp. SG63]